MTTFYWLLRTTGETRGRRNEQFTHPAYAKPELLASGPRELWSWDYHQAQGQAKWVCFHLYVILDVFSRYVVVWMIAPRESAELAHELICHHLRQGIVRGNSPCMPTAAPRCAPSLWRFADLGVTKRHSRPHVSDDNTVLGSAVQDPEVPALLPGAL